MLRRCCWPLVTRDLAAQAPTLGLIAPAAQAMAMAMARWARPVKASGSQAD